MCAFLHLPLERASRQARRARQGDEGLPTPATERSTEGAIRAVANEPYQMAGLLPSAITRPPRAALPGTRSYRRSLSCRILRPGEPVPAFVVVALAPLRFAAHNRPGGNAWQRES